MRVNPLRQLLPAIQREQLKQWNCEHFEAQILGYDDGRDATTYQATQASYQPSQKRIPNGGQAPLLT